MVRLSGLFPSASAALLDQSSFTFALHEWLDGKGLQKYAGLFEAAGLEGGDLGELDDDQLSAMGLPLGARQKALQAVPQVAGMRPIPFVVLLAVLFPVGLTST